MSLLKVAANMGAGLAAAARNVMHGQAGGGPLKSGAVNKALSNMNKSGYGAKISKAVRPSK